ncbi:hypothetical protein [Streptomyces sp. JH34]|uniref:hypothetical protein n=1 Tax=Streptomyces sp. JH34 TaxID=2793633 RepID=UPI0023F6D983|nr:hypothetical protein [Streptomyces sp. JH34]MDF6020728.1 hypothetical protein [Streptomyces sp. JH34]
MAAVPFMGVTSAAAAAELATELTSFKKFRNRIDEILIALKESPADATQLGQDPMKRAQFGGGDYHWAEAASLFMSYQTVITELETLSKTLSDSIEGLSIAVLASHNGYENLDIDIRRRMLEISDGVKEQYGGEYDPTGRRNGDTTPDTPKPEPTTGAI